MTTMTLLDTILYYDGEQLLWGEHNGTRYLIMCISEDMMTYLCTPVDDLDVPVREVFKNSTHTMEWNHCTMKAIEIVPDDWLPDTDESIREFTS